MKILDQENISKGADVIKEMQKETKTSGLTTRDFVLNNKKDILDLKKKGFTYIEIAQRLQDAGVNISAQSLGRIVRTQTQGNKRKTTGASVNQTTTRHVTTEDDATIFEKA